MYTSPVQTAFIYTILIVFIFVVIFCIFQSGLTLTPTASTAWKYLHLQRTLSLAFSPSLLKSIRSFSMALSKPLSKHSESLPSLEPEVDSYKAKYEHLKATVKQLYKERQTLLARVHGLESLSTLLSETRQENKELHEKNSKLEATIATYQGRLSSIGASLSLSFEEGEPFVPGPSRQLLDNLVKENARLRQNLKFTNCDPQRLTDLTEVRFNCQ